MVAPGLRSSVEVERPIVVGVVGTHSTGKTVFLTRLTNELRRRDVQVATVADLGEQAQRLGMPILFNHTATSTRWFITRGISHELEAWQHAEVVLVDRAVPDALGYYLAALEYRSEQADADALSELQSLVISHSRHYDLLFRTLLDPLVPLGTNKIRDRDQAFRALADRHVGRVVSDLGLRCEPLPASGHEQALRRALTFVTNRLAGHPTN